MNNRVCGFCKRPHEDWYELGLNGLGVNHCPCYLWVMLGSITRMARA